MTARFCILARMDQALERMRAQGVEVRAICLSARTHDEFDKAMCRKVKEARGLKRYKASFLSYLDYPIHRSKADVIYSKQGVGFTIHKKLSPRVESEMMEAA